MTLLDRALIKAYAEIGSSSHAREHREGEAPAASVLSRGQGSKSNSAPRERRPSEFQPSRGETFSISQTAALAVERHRASGGGVAPLSAFASPSRPQESFRALLEVDHLAWPEACDGLLARARAEWDLFAEQLSRHIGQGTRCIGLSSCQRGEGRTSVALATAKLLASRGPRSVVVDADFERPSLADSCGISVQAGWGDVLAGELSLGEALIAATQDRVALLPWHGPRMGAAQWANTLPITTSFNTLRDHFDLLVLDTMPLDTATAISEFATLAEATLMDAVYMIFDARSTPPSTLTDTCAKLRHAGLRVAGLIENFASAAPTPAMTQTQHAPTALIPAKRGTPLTD
jgi:Mrp family chromosome partitioning ATPase